MVGRTWAGVRARIRACGTARVGGVVRVEARLAAERGCTARAAIKAAEARRPACNGGRVACSSRPAAAGAAGGRSKVGIGRASLIATEAAAGARRGCCCGDPRDLTATCILVLAVCVLATASRWLLLVATPPSAPAAPRRLRRRRPC